MNIVFIRSVILIIALEGFVFYHIQNINKQKSILTKAHYGVYHYF